MPQGFFHTAPTQLLHYYPFGSVMQTRSYAARAGRFGFNGKERDPENFEGAYDFGARIYDGRIGRWLAVDPCFDRFSSESVFNYCGNSPNIFIDPDGKKRIITYIYKKADGSSETAVVTDDDLIAKTVWVDNLMDKHDQHKEYDWYDYSQTITINYDANGVETSRTKSAIEYDKKRTRTWYNVKWFAKAIVDDGVHENYGGVLWTSKNGKGEETKKTNRPDINTEDIDALMRLLGNSKTTFGEKGTIDYIMYALDLITDGGNNLEKWDEKLKEYDKKFVYKCCHNWLYGSDGKVVNQDGKVPEGKKLSKKKHVCEAKCSN